MNTILKRFRDFLAELVPWWLSDRTRTGPGVNVAYRFLWVMVATLDVYADVMVQGLLAAWPGKGTVTALPLIGRSRGVLRGQSDTDDEYIAKLITWLDDAKLLGSQLGIALALHRFLGNHPRVRVINRAGRWVTVNQDGSVSVVDAAWDWDSVSNPERAGYWWNLWIVIYPTQWAVRPLTVGDLTGDDGYGLGHLVTRAEVDAVQGLIDQWKSEHSHVVSVIWTSDAARFDPAVALSKPNGNWGRYGKYDGGGNYVVGDRDTTTCRYWETH